MQQMFSGCNKLKRLDISNWDAGNVTACIYMFDSCRALETLVGGKTIEEVGNDISCLRGLEIGQNLSLNNTIIDRASLRAVINGLADVTDQPAESRPTLTLGTTLMAKLKDEDIAIVTNKGWNLA
jgi:surface protein